MESPGQVAASLRPDASCALTDSVVGADHEVVDSARITSRHNPRIKDALQLRRRKWRQRRRQFLIDGAREIMRAVEAGISCRVVFVCDELCRSVDAREALDRLRVAGAEVVGTSSDVFARLAFGERQEGLVVVADAPQRQLDRVQLCSNPLITVLEGIEKPGNLGAILRTADGAGLDAVLVADSRTDLFNPNTIRASLGTVFPAKVCATTAQRALEWLRQHEGLTIYAACPDATDLPNRADLRGPTAIVLGSEATGLTEIWNAADVQRLRLPMHGLADSLNVSATAAVFFYEALRQRSAT